MQKKFHCISVNLYNSTATLALVLDSQYKTQILSNSVNVEDAKQLLIEKFNKPIDIDPCEWWKHHKVQYLLLEKIAYDYIYIPATSVPSEQAFSKSGELVSKKRNRLGDHAIEACMCLNS
ncbi:unnamed protein product [Rhizophagus irregularis]|nr:unnamed protein product [Rhizophagus irregularis]